MGTNSVEFFSVSAGGAAEAPKLITVRIAATVATPVLADFAHPDSPQLVGDAWFGERKGYRIAGGQADVGDGGVAVYNKPGSGLGAAQEARMRLTAADPASRTTRCC